MKVEIPFLPWAAKASLEVEIPGDTEDRFRLKVALELSVKANANLDGANLDGANLVRANLYGANLVRANLVRANLVRANLYGASLDGANLDRANLDGANLDGANLVRANLDGASLDGANLVRANLDGASLDGKKIKSTLAICSRVIEPYQFVLWRMQEGEALVCAGCHGPWTITRYREHVAQNYRGTPKAAETLRILDHFEATASATGDAS